MRSEIQMIEKQSAILNVCMLIDRNLWLFVHLFFFVLVLNYCRLQFKTNFMWKMLCFPFFFFLLFLV
ncbi:hypothetical protein XELAEV_18008078mg [Xenopus laevis]|uniref:Uncharacterized protein n=1 Tax=Xenopus laevis TaxID=8355 RepID=A0A974E220_XENLA|nr:hypothetical protein XELAEV_18008078mg [Xenopus laevis]